MNELKPQNKAISVYKNGFILDPKFNLFSIFKSKHDNNEISKNKILKLLKKINFNSEGLSKKYQKNKKLQYKKIPIWVLCNGWDFGTICNLYNLLNIELKKEITKSFSKIVWLPNQFLKIMDALRKIRNIISHNNVLFNIKIKIRNCQIEDFFSSNNINIQKTLNGIDYSILLR